MNETRLNFWLSLLRVFKRTNDKKKSYTTKKPDFISMAYLFLLISIALFIVVKISTDSKFALPVLFMIPTFVGVFVFYILLPIRLLNFVISQIIIFFYLRKIKKSTSSKTVVVTGKSEYRSPSFWFSPNYGLELIFLLEYLKLKDEDFSIYKNVDLETLDAIMSNKNISTVYLFGHGRTHGFAIDSNTVVDYCRYNDPRYEKQYVYQIHCNPQKGTSLVEYVVDEKNKNECLPEHGYLSNFGISQMFIDKIIAYKNYGKFLSFIVNIWYNFLALTVPLFTLIIWMLIFTKIIG